MILSSKVPKNMYPGKKKKQTRLSINRTASFLRLVAINAFPDKNIPMGDKIHVAIMPISKNQ